MNFLTLKCNKPVTQEFTSPWMHYKVMNFRTFLCNKPVIHEYTSQQIRSILLIIYEHWLLRIKVPVIPQYMYMHLTDRSSRDTHFQQYDCMQIFLSSYHDGFTTVGMPVASMGVSGQMMVNKPRTGSFVQSGPAPPPTAAQGWVFLLSFLRFPIISLSHDIILLNEFFCLVAWQCLTGANWSILRCSIPTTDISEGI